MRRWPWVQGNWTLVLLTSLTGDGLRILSEWALGCDADRRARPLIQWTLQGSLDGAALRAAPQKMNEIPPSKPCFETITE